MHEDFWRCKPHYTGGQQHISDKKHRLKAYRDEVWKIRDSFMFFELSYIPRDLNHLVDSLAVSTSLFVPSLPPKLSYDVQVKYRPSLPDNVKFWKVFALMTVYY